MDNFSIMNILQAIHYFSGDLGLIIGIVGMFYSIKSFLRIRTVKESLAEFKQELLDKRKQADFLSEKKRIAVKSKRIVKEMKNKRVEGFKLYADLNEVAGEARRLIHSFSECLEYAPMPAEEKKILLELIDMIDSHNNGEIKAEVFMGKIIQYLTMVGKFAEGRDYNEL